MLTEHPVKEFQAFTDCPNCGSVELHEIGTPPQPECNLWYRRAEILETIREQESTEDIYTYGSLFPTRTYIGHKAKRYKTNTKTCDVIRTCQHCETSWGEK